MRHKLNRMVLTVFVGLAAMTQQLRADILYSVTDLGTLGGSSSYAYGINSSGQVVGWTDIGDISDGNRVEHAFLYSGLTMTDLNSLIDPSSGWELDSAQAINDAGQIVGYGINGLGQEHAFLLTPTPEPSTLVLLGVAAIGLLGYAQRRRVAVAALTLFLLVSLSSLASADTIYNFISYPDDQNQAVLSGVIQTDGHTGSLSSADILSYNLQIATTTGTLQATGTYGGIGGSGLYATATALTLPSSASFSVGGQLWEIDWSNGYNGLYEYRSYNLDRSDNPNPWQEWITFNPSMGGTNPWVIAAVPEPSTLALLGVGAISLLRYTWRRRVLNLTACRFRRGSVASIAF